MNLMYVVIICCCLFYIIPKFSLSPAFGLYLRGTFNVVSFITYRFWFDLFRKSFSNTNSKHTCIHCGKPFKQTDRVMNVGGILIHEKMSCVWPVSIDTQDTVYKSIPSYTYKEWLKIRKNK